MLQLIIDTREMLQLVKFENTEDDESKSDGDKPTTIDPIARKHLPIDTDFKLQDTVDVQLIDKGNYALVPSALQIDDKDVISCLCVSDTHGQHHNIEPVFGELPCADLLIHCGDFTNIGHWGDIKSCDAWIQQLLEKRKNFKHCVLIAGNHDITLDADYYVRSGYNRFHAGNPEKTDMLRYRQKCADRARKHSVYLQDSRTELFGVSFYGSPWVPSGNNWAFMKQRGKELQQKWTQIPMDVDILMTHGPPLYHGDVCGTLDEELQSNCVGDAALLQRILQVQPQFHIYGHNHEGYGVTMHKGLNTVFINASTLNRDYKVANKPIMFYIEKKKKE